jgi:phosphonate transport system substrate-binding protein
MWRASCFASILAASILAGPSTAQESIIELKFGVYTTDRATEMYRTFYPILEVLQEDLSARLQQRTDIALRIYRSYEEALDALVNGEVDFVRFGPASYVLAKNRNPDVSLLAMEHKNGETQFEGMIVVPTESPAKTLADLRGQSFAFGDKNSTIGRYLAQEQLLSAGITATDLSHHEFLGRHDKVFKAVELGDFDAGSLKSNTFKKLNKNDQLRVLASFLNVTKPWVARAGLQKEFQQGLSGALISITDETSLASLKVSGFYETSDEHYKSTRESMRTAIDFDATPANPPAPQKPPLGESKPSRDKQPAKS